MRKISKLLAFSAFMIFNLVAYYGHAQWAQGSGIDGGDYRCLAKSGTNIFAGSQYGGVFLSTNNGDSWMPKMAGLPGGVSVTQLMFNGTSLFAGTSYWSKTGQGVFRSDDNGETWVQKNNGIDVNLTPYFTDLYITGLAKTNAYIFTSTYQNGIFRSANNGDAWVKVFDAYGPDTTGTGVDSTVLREIFSMTAIGNVIFAGGMGSTLGVFRSSDQGLTWDVLSTGLPSGVIIYQLTSSGSDLYVRTSHGFFWSPNNGDYFIGINNGITKPEGAASGTITVDNLTVYAATMDGSEGPRTYKSTNRGSTWTGIPDLSSYYVESLLISGSTVFAGHIGNYGITSNGGGVVRSLDNGSTWAAASIGLSGLNCKSFTSHGLDIFAGTYYYSGIFHSTDIGSTWTKSTLPGTTTNYQVQAMTTSGTSIYAGINATIGVFKSDDNGLTWAQTTSIGKQVWAMATNSTYVFAGTNTDGMRRTSNGGTTWTTINSGLPTIGEKSIRCITVYGTKIYIGTARGVFLSTNDGTTWTAANGGTSSPGYGLVKAVAVYGDTLFAAATGGIIRSYDKGVTWTLLTASYTMASTLLFNGNTLYAGGTGGVYMSNDWGGTWTSLNASFPSTPEVNNLYIANGLLYAGTYGQSVWKYSLIMPPVAYSVTGTGSYCEVGGGLPVGLSNSETGVTYTLYKNTVAQVPTMAGTGSAISFGNQLAGMYTVSGTNTGGTTTMNGSAVLTETQALPVSVTITANVNPVPAGTSITFTAIPANGGTLPSCQWQVNGINAGTDNPVFTYTPANADKVICILTSSETCTTGSPATSNQIAVTVIPEIIHLQNIIITDGETNCYDAIQTIYVAGDGTTFTVQSGGSATMIAGQNIIYLPGTKADSGSYMHGYITLTGNYCITPLNPVVSGKVMSDKPFSETPEFSMKGAVRVYPNPASSSFTLEIAGEATSGMKTIEIYSMNGLKVFTRECNGEYMQSVPVSQLRPGVYFVSVTTGTGRQTLKLIKL